MKWRIMACVAIPADRFQQVSNKLSTRTVRYSSLHGAWKVTWWDEKLATVPYCMLPAIVAPSRFATYDCMRYTYEFELIILISISHHRVVVLLIEE